MTPNDISTPKKAEDATRQAHPLELIYPPAGTRVKVITDLNEDRGLDMGKEEEELVGQRGTYLRYLVDEDHFPHLIQLDDGRAVSFAREELIW